MSKESITYILGAGASFQSFPVVNSFPNRFAQFRDSLEIIITDQRTEYVIRRKFALALEPTKILAKDFRAHHSFDTYFKKLFHTNEFFQIKLFKKILNLYFIWEHLQTFESLRSDITDEIFIKRSEIDKRYDALVAGLLKPLKTQKTTFCKINFISWNYDLNLISSIKNYFFPKLNFKDFFEKLQFNSFELKINDDISILNMNGYFFSHCFDNLKNIREANFIECLNKKVIENFFDDSHDDEDASLIRFAWELSDQEFTSVVDIAKEFIFESKNIVVIGYTFPLYNRLLNLQYIGINNVIYKYITIQNPNAIEIREDFLTNFNLHSIQNQILPKSQCESFFVPEGIFKL